ncbi:MAG TPA: hypothetical protein VKV21_00175 [Solirubrobacteraceae bacterium]|nr:hypothetical protein [Solirubrobacteraceae bacterium]
MSRRSLVRAVPVASAVALCAGMAWDVRQVAETQTSFCSASGHGTTEVGAMRAYLRRCGSDYSLGGRVGPRSGRRSAEYTVNVTHNAEDSVGWMIVTRRGGVWRTSGPLGSGP